MSQDEPVLISVPEVPTDDEIASVRSGFTISPRMPFLSIISASLRFPMMRTVRLHGNIRIISGYEQEQDRIGRSRWIACCGPRLSHCHGSNVRSSLFIIYSYRYLLFGLCYTALEANRHVKSTFL